MPEANQKYVHHTELRVSDNGSTGPFEAIAGLVGDIPFPELDSELLDITPRQESNRRVWGTGLEDSPEMQIEIFYDDTDDAHQALAEAQQTKARKFYQFAAVGYTPWTVEMLVRRFAPMSPSGGYMRAQVTFKPTGDIDRENGDGDGDGDSDGGDG